MTAQSVALTLGGARRTQGGWLAKCPLRFHGRGRGDRNPSLSLHDGESGRLLICCFAGCDPRDVLAELRLRGEVHGTSEYAPLRPSPAKAANPAKADSDETRTEVAKRIWHMTEPAVGTIVEPYLASRSITVPPPESLRFHPNLWHSKTKCSFPAMVAGVQGLDGRLTGIHRTYLRADGLGKALVDPARMMLGKCAGGAVRLAKVAEVLQVAEGVETALAVLQATAQPTWAALSTSGLQALILPSSVRRVTILADGDEAGEHAALFAAKRFTREGRAVNIAQAPNGYDFADVLAGKVTVLSEGAAK